MAKLFDGMCTNEDCVQQGEVVETWADQVDDSPDKKSRILVGAECEECRQQLLHVLAANPTVGSAPKSASRKPDMIRYYETKPGMSVPPKGSFVLTSDPTVTNQAGPLKIGEVFHVTDTEGNSVN
ncbi:hypothetical protein ACFL3T_01260 [Patescibacteria group bacterium]